METLTETTGILEAALDYAERGLPIIPLNGKIPALPGWQEFEATPGNVRLWFVPGRNIGLRTGESGYIAVDTDTAEAEDWVLNHLTETPMKAVTGSGSTHRFYHRPPRKEIRNKQAWRGIQGLDIRGQGGFIVLSPSIHPETGRPYEWLTEFLPADQLPVFSPRWVYERRKKVQSTIAEVFDPNRVVLRGRAYVDSFERRAISGHGGQDSLFVGALKIVSFVRKLGGNEGDAWELILHFNNTKCDPPWDLSDPQEERALHHKFVDALRLAR